MRRFCFGMALMLLGAAARADDAADQPFLVFQSGGHTAPVWKILFTPDGKEILTVSEDKTVRRWDAATGQRLGVLRLPVGPGLQGALRAGAVFFSPDGKTKTLAVAGDGYTADDKRVVPIFLIDLDAEKITATIQGTSQSAVFSLAFSHDGKLLASGCYDGEVFLWDAASGNQLQTLKGHKDRVRDLAFSPDDKLLATASRDKTARLWSVKDGKEVAPPMEHRSPVISVAWKDDNVLATGGVEDDYIQTWDRKGKRLKHYDKLCIDHPFIESITFLPGGKEVVYAWSRYIGDEYSKSGWGVLDLANPDKPREGYSWEHFRTENRGAVSADGTIVAVSGGGQNRVDVCTVKDGKKVLSLAGKGRTAYHAGWFQGGWLVHWGGTHWGGVETPDGTFDLSELRFDPKGHPWAGGTVHDRGDLHIAIRDLEYVEVKRKSDIIAKIPVPRGQVLTTASLISGDRVALGFNERVWLYDAATGKLIRRLQGPTGQVCELRLSGDGRYLLSAFSDQTIRIWDPDKEQPLLSLFMAGADWIIWTPEGYYAASPGGERLMGWQVNNGLDQLGTFYPAAQFHKAFYRPDVIKRVLIEGSVEKALEAADKARGAKTEAVEVARALPPEVSILAPAGGPLDKADLEVQAQAQCKGRPVVSLRLLLDGRPCPGAEVQKFADAKPGDRQEASWKVTLPEGAHHLSVLAESDVSSAASREVAVTYQPAAQEALPTLYVLAIGINDYPGSLQLNWAVKDATSIEAAFKNAAAPQPFAKVETKSLLDKDATKAGILAGLDWLKQKMTGDDTAVVFYAGHGHRDRKTSQFYMLPFDVNVNALPTTGVTGTQLKDKLKAVPGRVLVLLDACHSGSIGNSPPDPLSLTDDVQRELAAPDCGVVILCAAMAQEEAGESAEVKDGYFTAALLSGLGGGAPASKDGLVHLTALNFYVEEQVSELSKDEQHVVVDRPSTVTSFPLVKGGGKTEEK